MPFLEIVNERLDIGLALKLAGTTYQAMKKCVDFYYLKLGDPPPPVPNNINVKNDRELPSTSLLTLHLLYH